MARILTASAELDSVIDEYDYFLSGAQLNETKYICILQLLDNNLGTKSVRYLEV